MRAQFSPGTWNAWFLAIAAVSPVRVNTLQIRQAITGCLPHIHESFTCLTEVVTAAAYKQHKGSRMALAPSADLVVKLSAGA